MRITVNERVMITKDSTEIMRNKHKQASLQSINSTKDVFVNIESSVSNCKNWNKA